MKPPDFTFRGDRPVESTGAVNENTLPWAIVERLDYIASALYELVRRLDGTEEET